MSWLLRGSRAGRPSVHFDKALRLAGEPEDHEHLPPTAEHQEEPARRRGDPAPHVSAQAREL